MQRMTRWAAWAAGTMLLLAGAGRARAADQEEPAPVQRLPAVDVRAPRVYAGPGSTAPPQTVTALRRESVILDVPAAVTSLEGGEIRMRRMVRSMPDALLGVPGVMVQKTAPLQASPYVRGFTGYQNLLLIDGIRLNNAAFRAGPNQYWSTVDPYTIERLELARGPYSVLYGSDAIGGTLNAIPRRRTSFLPGTHVGGALRFRGATGERMVAGRVEVEGNRDDVGWFAGVTGRSYGNIVSGGGTLPGTGGIEEFDADVRLDWRLRRWWELTVAWQRVRQTDAPRTEQTVFAVPFQGTAVGGDLQRDLDQERDLLYTRLSFDSGGCARPISRGHLTLSYHRHGEEQDRLRTGDRRDLSGFTLEQVGAQLQLETPSRFGRFVYGVEYTHDEVDSFRNDFVGGVLTLSEIQGPLGDDGRYDLLGVYLQDHMDFGRFELIAGGRFTYAAAGADRVDNPAVAGADPATPGNTIAVDDSWTSLVGSLRGIYTVNRCWRLFGGVSQAFRAPSLSDLTALDSTSVVESPAPGLDPERAVGFELGVKTEQDRLAAETAVWATRLDDAIIRSPTGTLVGGTPEVRKDNIGDGWVWGFELEAAWRPRPAWVVFGNVSWMDAEVDELDPATGQLVKSPLSRQQPWRGLAGVRLEPRGCRIWGQAEVVWSDRADQLSLRDLTDTRRIPPGGTPSWTVVNLRSGIKLSRRVRASVALENVLDEDYRIHGSGVNEPGRSLVGAVEFEW